MSPSALHHVELWVADLGAARSQWGWLCGRLGWVVREHWPDGSSWGNGGTYLVVTTPPAIVDGEHDRRRSGMNHLAFTADAATVDAIAGGGGGWTALYADKFPHAGGAEHYAAYLENDAGFKVEIVAR